MEYIEQVLCQNELTLANSLELAISILEKIDTDDFDTVVDGKPIRSSELVSVLIPKFRSLFLKYSGVRYD